MLWATLFDAASDHYDMMMMIICQEFGFDSSFFFLFVYGLCRCLVYSKCSTPSNAPNSISDKSKNLMRWHVFCLQCSLSASSYFLLIGEPLPKTVGKLGRFNFNRIITENRAKNSLFSLFTLNSKGIRPVKWNKGHSNVLFLQYLHL